MTPPSTVHLHHRPDRPGKDPDETLAEYLHRRQFSHRYRTELTTAIRTALAAARPDPDTPPF
ncbi:hypothetical protein SAMN04515671_0833 [Nakamurella panacisegetis]|uniref:Uncharacterized protein n=1 Tax=Nakamurella panacisegetis TaxID=1090615 RepID=A0A1H0JA00_9ACTN|nr:hypothetical protein [Nakamurella panacisegetis]SDO40432.1 hypothetical protein SAMN04515671_0833 [Nakamurella panacisegetis]